MTEEQARRVGLNEALFREVNEEIDRLNRAFGGVETMSVICECGDGECTTQLGVPVAEYERIRADSTLFFVALDHEIPELETVVEHTDGYAVVRKRPGAPADVAEETDPRS